MDIEAFRLESGETQVLYGGLAAYSDLAILKDGTAGVLWERGISELSQFITFTSFNREFLERPGIPAPEIRMGR
jgi:hypothetical protein